MDPKNNAFAKQGLRNRITVCRHIAHSIENKERERSVVPVVTQIIDMLANTFWCCDECSKKYGVPCTGALVRYSSEQIASEESEQFSHPYSRLISSEIVSSVSPAAFKEKFGRISEELDLDGLTEEYFSKI